jgi:hypothetical protein
MRAVNTGTNTDTGTNTGTNTFPLTSAKDHTAPSLFEPANLLREAVVDES